MPSLSGHAVRGAIVEMNNGTVLVCSEKLPNNVLRISESGLTVFGEALTSSCTTLERDEGGNVYVGLGNGQIVTIAEDGTTAAWAQIDPGNEPFTLHYDKINSSLVAITRDSGNDSSGFWRSNLDDPTATELYLELQGITSIAGAVDDVGNIYVLDRNENVIYKINEGTSPPVIFASNVLDSEAITGPSMEYLNVEGRCCTAREQIAFFKFGINGIIQTHDALKQQVARTKRALTEKEQLTVDKQVYGITIAKAQFLNSFSLGVDDGTSK